MNRLLTHFCVAALAVLLSLTSGSGSAQVVELQSGLYEVEHGTTVEMAGGFFGYSYDMEFSGTLRLQTDHAAETGRILESDLWLFSEELGSTPIAFPIQGDLPLGALDGALLDSSTLQLVSPEGGPFPYQTALLTLTASPGGMVLDGVYDQGCCDRYVLTFEDAPFRLLSGPTAAAIPSLGPTGTVVLILVSGFVGALLLRRRF